MMDFNTILNGPGTIQVPGAFDALSARLIADAGYPMVYIT